MYSCEGGVEEATSYLGDKNPQLWPEMADLFAFFGSDWESKCER